jgi:predicted P-loop ATPase
MDQHSNYEDLSVIRAQRAAKQKSREAEKRQGASKAVANLASAMAMLRHNPALSDLVAYDEMLCAIMLMKPVPARDGAHGIPNGFKPRPLTDVDVSAIQEWLQLHGLKKLGKDTMHQAVDLRAEERKFHPLRDYLDNLVWDGKERLGSWLADYLGAERTAYTAGIGRMFMVATVARIFEPGCKCDYMMVLEGQQGARKSTACAILGGTWYSDNLPDATSGKDVSQHLQGKWIIEIGEMSAMGKAENTALKAFITRTVERYRPSYGRKEIQQLRQCVFIGSTNKAAYLRDETGGRRFWPVEVTNIDTVTLARDRDQLFAEAVALYRNGARWWPDADFERQHIKPQQDARFEADIWEERIAEYLNLSSKVTVGGVATGALGLDTPKIGRADQNRITAAMERLCWRRLNDGKPDGHGKRWWVKA